MVNKQNKNLEKEIDNYIGNDPLLTKNDKDKFFQWFQQQNANTLRGKLFYRLLSIIILIAFVAVLYIILA